MAREFNDPPLAVDEFDLSTPYDNADLVVRPGQAG